jgi:hypothetical protein
VSDAIKLDAMFCVLIVASAAPLWRAQIGNGRRGVPLAFVLLVVSISLQLVFANLISFGFLQMQHSVAFAVIGRAAFWR